MQFLIRLMKRILATVVILRNETIVTIDGADAKDLDDAVTVTKLENGIINLVSILPM